MKLLIVDIYTKKESTPFQVNKKLGWVKTVLPFRLIFELAQLSLFKIKTLAVLNSCHRFGGPQPDHRTTTTAQK